MKNKRILLFIGMIYQSSLAFALTPLGFSPWIGSNCYSESWEGEIMHGTCIKNTNTNGYPRWTISATHENADFSGGSHDDIKISDPVMDISFAQRGDYPDKYEIKFELDKINFPSYRDKNGRDIKLGFTGIFISDTPYARNFSQTPTFKFSEDINLYLEVNLQSSQQTIVTNPSWVGNAEIRVLLGVVAYWDGVPHYMEFNLMRTPGFDRCGDINISQQPTNPYTWRPLLGEVPSYGITSAYPQGLGLGSICDTSNTYDHRYVSLDGASYYNSDHVISELVYYNISGLPISPQQPLTSGNGYKAFDIPISRLFRAYNWAHKPVNSSGQVDWASVQSYNSNDPSNGYIAFYFGTEIYGAGKLNMKMRTFNIYKN